MIRGGYLGYAVSGTDLAKLQQDTAERIKEFGLDKFDSIAFRGVSGALVAPAVAAMLNKNILIVRKLNQETSHSFSSVEGYPNSKKYIIIDDFISSGATINTIRQEITKESEGQAECVAIFLYGQLLVKDQRFTFKKENYFDDVFTVPQIGTMERR